MNSTRQKQSNPVDMLRERTLESLIKPVDARARFIIVLIGVFLALTAWAISSPVGSSPDDDFHLASIWCGDGPRQGLCVSGTTLAQSICFAYNANATGACQAGKLEISESLFFVTDRVNSTGLYPPAFYATLGIFASSHLQTSVIAMRMFNVFLFMGLTTALWLTLGSRLKRALVITYTVTLVPLGLFLIPSTNPSSWAIIGMGNFFFSLIALLRETSRRKQAVLIMLAVLSFGLLAGSRGDAAAFSVVAMVAAVLISRTPMRTASLRYAVMLMLTLAAILTFFATGQANVAADGLRDASSSPSTLSGLNLLLSNILNLPSLMMGVFGSWGLGWLDTLLPPTVWILASGAALISMFQGLSESSTWKNLATGVVLTATLAFPLIVLSKSHAAVGAYVQPRYLLPLIILLVATTVAPAENAVGRDLNRVQRFVLASFLLIAFTVALHLNMDRYISGASHPSWNLMTADGWWWPVAIPALGVWLGGSLGMLMLLWGVYAQKITPQADLATGREPITSIEEGP
jgi:hypothetical protein